MTTITLQIKRPWVHGSLMITRMDESRVRVQAFGLTVNTVPVNIESVLVCGRFDEWRAESFEVQRVSKAGYTTGNSGSMWKPSRRNQEKAREVILDVVSEWAGTPPRPKPQPLRVAAEDCNDGILAELLLA